MSQSLNKAINRQPVTAVGELNTNDILNDREMDTMMEYTCQILLDDDFIDTDDVNLFQEEII